MQIVTVSVAFSETYHELIGTVAYATALESSTQVGGAMLLHDEQEAGVGSSEAERVRHDSVQFLLLWLARHVVECELICRLRQVERGRHHVLLDTIHQSNKWVS